MKVNARLLALMVALVCARSPSAAGPSRCTGASPGLPPVRDNSEGCLACHDGVLATNITTAKADARAQSGPGNHPVMVSYLQAYFRAPERFVAPVRLDPRVRLVNGAIQCVSCHALSATGQWALVKSNQRSDLCLSCHRK